MFNTDRPQWTISALKGTWRHVQTWPAKVLDAVLPQGCPGCGLRLRVGEPLGFCTTCYARMPWWNPHMVLPPQHAATISRVSAPLLYEEPLRAAIIAFKFADRTDLAPLFARLMAGHLAASAQAVLVPVPSHPKRLRERCYNPAALIAHELAQLTGLKADLTSLTRVRYEAPQQTLSRAARLKLTRTHFACGPALFGKDVVLIDDIYTTGATVAACAGALRHAGAAQVQVVTLAYTKPG